MGRLLKEMVIIALAVIAVIYLINPTAGFIEFIPDNFPLIGNLDEAGATLILLGVLRYYGIDLDRFLGKRNPQLPAGKRNPQLPQRPQSLPK